MYRDENVAIENNELANKITEYLKTKSIPPILKVRNRIKKFTPSAANFLKLKNIENQ